MDDITITQERYPRKVFFVNIILAIVIVALIINIVVSYIFVSESAEDIEVILMWISIITLNASIIPLIYIIYKKKKGDIEDTVEGTIKEGAEGIFEYFKKKPELLSAIKISLKYVVIGLLFIISAVSWIILTIFTEDFFWLQVLMANILVSSTVIGIMVLIMIIFKSVMSSITSITGMFKKKS